MFSKAPVSSKHMIQKPCLQAWLTTHDHDIVF